MVQDWLEGRGAAGALLVGTAPAQVAFASANIAIHARRRATVTTAPRA
jgi:hypothetical protein